jgi:hypothetical protein
MKLSPATFDPNRPVKRIGNQGGAHLFGMLARRNMEIHLVEE